MENKNQVRCVISAKFHPHKDKWTGLKIEMGKKGTHENYNVIYNGECNGEYFDTAREAKDFAYLKTEL
jgi:hypothetical protein